MDLRRRLKQSALRTAAHACGPHVHQRIAASWSGIGCILMMHRVVKEKCDSPALDLSITIEYFDRALTALRNAGAEFVSLSTLGKLLVAKQRPARHAIALTFDDGFREHLVHALPVLRKHQAPATFFIPTGAQDGDMDVWFLRLEKAVMSSESIRVDFPNFSRTLPAGSAAEKAAAYQQLAAFVYSDRRANRGLMKSLLPTRQISDEALIDEYFMSWDELREAAADPLITIGGHTVTHPVLQDLCESEARAEITDVRARLSAKLNLPVTEFAYPYGGRKECGEREFRLARQAGYEFAVTTRYDCVRPSHAQKRFALPRLTLGGIREDLSALAFDVFSNEHAFENDSALSLAG